MDIMDADPSVVGQNAGFEGRLKIYKDILLYHSLINIYYTKKTLIVIHQVLFK